MLSVLIMFPALYANLTYLGAFPSEKTTLFGEFLRINAQHD